MLLLFLSRARAARGVGEIKGETEGGLSGEQSCLFCHNDSNGGVRQICVERERERVGE